MQQVEWSDASFDWDDELEIKEMELKNVPVVGVLFEGRQMLLMEVDENDEVTLKKEPDNPYDPNAIKVLVKGLHVGYIPRTMASTMAKYSEEQMKAKIGVIYKGAEIIGMRINITILNDSEPSK